MCMDRATLCRVDAGRVDAGMTEDVSQPGKVMVDEVEQPDKKMPQIMRKDFFGGILWHTGTKPSYRARCCSCPVVCRFGW